MHAGITFDIINYQLPQTGQVTLKIYDILGKEVSTLVSEQKTQGRYSVNFNASEAPKDIPDFKHPAYHSLAVTVAT